MKYRVHYSILEGDEKGYPPDHKRFQTGSRRSCLYKIAKSQNKVKRSNELIIIILLRTFTD